MSGIVSIKTNANRVAIKLQKFGSMDTTALMRIIAGDLEDITQTAFEKETDPATGRAWRRLHPRTIEDRRRKGYWPGKMLRRTGILKNSITSRYTKTKARIGTSTEYAEPNQRSRRYIGMGPKHRQQLRKTAGRFVKKQFNSA